MPPDTQDEKNVIPFDVRSVWNGTETSKVECVNGEMRGQCGFLYNYCI